MRPDRAIHRLALARLSANFASGMLSFGLLAGLDPAIIVRHTIPNRVTRMLIPRVVLAGLPAAGLLSLSFFLAVFAPVDTRLRAEHKVRIT